MPLLQKLKSLFGLDESSSSSGRQGDVGVTVEHEPSDAEASTGTEDAVKGTDTSTKHEDKSAATDQETDTEPAERDSATEASAESAEPSDATDTADAGDSSEPVDKVKGIGPAYADRLADVGIETVADLAAADAETIASQTDLSEKRVSRWIERAKLRAN